MPLYTSIGVNKLVFDLWLYTFGAMPRNAESGRYRKSNQDHQNILIHVSP